MTFLLEPFCLRIDVAKSSFPRIDWRGARFVVLACEVGAKLIRVRAQVAELQGSVKVFQRQSNQRVCPVEDMPGLIPAESGWMEDRQAREPHSSS